MAVFLKEAVWSLKYKFFYCKLIKDESIFIQVTFLSVVQDLSLHSADFWEMLFILVVYFEFRLNWIQFFVIVVFNGFHVSFAIIFTVH